VNNVGEVMTALRALSTVTLPAATARLTSINTLLGSMAAFIAASARNQREVGEAAGLVDVLSTLLFKYRPAPSVTTGLLNVISVLSRREEERGDTSNPNNVSLLGRSDFISGNSIIIISCNCWYHVLSFCNYCWVNYNKILPLKKYFLSCYQIYKCILN